MFCHYSPATILVIWAIERLLLTCCTKNLKRSVCLLYLVVLSVCTRKVKVEFEPISNLVRELSTTCVLREVCLDDVTLSHLSTSRNIESSLVITTLEACCSTTSHSVLARDASEPVKVRKCLTVCHRFFHVVRKSKFLKVIHLNVVVIDCILHYIDPLLCVRHWNILSDLSETILAVYIDSCLSALTGLSCNEDYTGICTRTVDRSC